jgi:hypothetical protein
MSTARAMAVGMLCRHFSDERSYCVCRRFPRRVFGEARWLGSSWPVERHEAFGTHDAPVHGRSSELEGNAMDRHVDAESSLSRKLFLWTMLYCIAFVFAALLASNA